VLRAAACLSLLAVLPATARAEPPVIAVFDIEDTSHPKARFDGQLLAKLDSYLEGRLAEGYAFRVVPKERLRRELAAAERLSYEACSEERCRVEIGKAVAAEKILSTLVIRIGRHCILRSVLLDLPNGVRERVANVKGACGDDELLGSIETLAGELKQERASVLDRPLTSLTLPAAPPPA
jgi:hypothetical protein